MVLLLVALMVVAGCYFLAGKLRTIGRLEDCALSGRTNCVTLPARR